MNELRTTPVRFTADNLGLVSSDDPYHFVVGRVVKRGDEGRLIVQGDLPIQVPDGWHLVHVDEDLYVPVHEAMIEVIR